MTDLARNSAPRNGGVDAFAREEIEHLEARVSGILDDLLSSRPQDSDPNAEDAASAIRWLFVQLLK